MLVAALSRYLDLVEVRGHLVPYSYTTCGRRAKTVLQYLTIGGLFTTGGPRPEGATAERIRFRNFENLRVRGRWVSRILEHYVQKCIASLNTTLLSARQEVLLDEVAWHGFEVWQDCLRCCDDVCHGIPLGRLIIADCGSQAPSLGCSASGCLRAAADHRVVASGRDRDEGGPRLTFKPLRGLGRSVT